MAIVISGQVLGEKKAKVKGEGAGGSSSKTFVSSGRVHTALWLNVCVPGRLAVPLN